jgi:hypothetical protein
MHFQVTFSGSGKNLSCLEKKLQICFLTINSIFVYIGVYEYKLVTATTIRTRSKPGVGARLSI